MILDQHGQPAVQTPACAHAGAIVSFDYAAAAGLDEREIRRRWPRFMGRCPDCAGFVIKYASWEHYIAGDW